MTITVGYVNGKERTVDPTEWSGIPAQGVDWVAATTGKYTTTASGFSVYWLYKERDYWVLGGGSLGGVIPPEVLIQESGHVARAIEYMPDLFIEAVKLGHWWTKWR